MEVNVRKRATVILASAVLALLTPDSMASAQQARRQTENDVVAVVGSTSITLSQVDDKALEVLTGAVGNIRLSEALYQARRAALDGIIAELLMGEEAKARGIERSALIQQEITSKIQPPADTEIAAWYEANPALLKGATLEQSRLAIRNLLIQQRAMVLRNEFLGRLNAGRSVRIMLEPPRRAVASAGHPTRGQEHSPIELIEFSDFECPFCLRAHATVEQVLSAYGDRVRFVYRQFPLPIHPHAVAAAEASECANEQGQFWPYYGRLFADPAKLEDGDLKADAVALGLDVAQFNGCVDSRHYRDAVERDIKEGAAVGVTSTPTFFINGRQLTGAQSFEVFKRVIDEELSRVQK
jgi:predicted DsbA family dithiol-disulfide isomerase